ncbi:MAG TPA: 2OG-Fe(II) oxygenase [Blastocatellia bacterium]
MVAAQIDSSKPLIKTLPGILNADECLGWIDRIKAMGPEAAPINTFGGPKIDSRIRNNRRVMFDDPEAARGLFDRVKDQAPAEIRNMRLSGINERLGCYEYFAGQRFAPHSDGPFIRDDRERSCYTFMVYLNEDFEGGETVFFVQPLKSIKPQAGMGLLFQHPIIHEGAKVINGVKYVIRTDLMYSW